MPKSDGQIVLSLLQRLHQEALSQQSSQMVLQKALQIVLEMSDWDYAAVSKLSDDHQMVEQLSFVSQEGVLPLHSYDLLGTPCQLVTLQSDIVCYLDMQQRFSDEKAVQNMQVQSYLGMMYYLSGQPMGHVYFMSKCIPTKTQVAQSKLLLQLLAVFVGSRVELIERHKELDEQKVKATVDVLTGAYNRRRFEQDIARIINQYQQSQLSDALLVMFDIDGLKGVNDTFGHPSGDEVIQLTSSLLHSHFREEDLVYRLGGDEFAVLLMGNTDHMKQTLQLRIDRIRQGLHQCRFPNIGISMGAGLLSQAKFEPLEWVRLSDFNLYKDKQEKARRLIT